MRTYLVKGDRVAVVAPSSRAQKTDTDFLERATSVLMDWGLEVCHKLSHDHHFYLAGSDVDRSSHFLEAVADAKVRCIFIARGGYGSQRILRHICEGLVDREILLVGCSDATALHCLILKRLERWHCIHGANIATSQFLSHSPESETNRKLLHAALFNPCPQDLDVDILIGGAASGRLMGGCLSIVSSLIGTPYLPSIDGSILFLEDIGEKPYRIDRMLTHMKNGGLLANVAGFAFGEMIGCVDQSNDIREILRDILSEFAKPLVFGLRSGHGAINYPIELGRSAKIDGSRGKITVNL